MTILVTGATGFIGSAIAQKLSANGNNLHLITRQENSTKLPGARIFTLGNLSNNTDWRQALMGVETIIHTAGIAHRHGVSAKVYRQTNVDACRHLAEMAVSAGVKHFIFLSSVGVHGRVTRSEAFIESSLYAPYNDYSRSKQQAEEMLLAIRADSSMALTIIRPPLVYAAHAPGNFARLLNIVRRGLPLPLGAIDNARSIIALENLADFIITCVAQAEARDQIFLVADTHPISTRKIVKLLAQGMKKPGSLYKVAPWLVQGIARFLRKEEQYLQLCGDLVLDTNKAKSLLGWQAPLDGEVALVQAGEKFICDRIDRVNKI